MKTYRWFTLCRFGALALCAIAFLLPACESDGHFAIFGYSTEPNYDCSIHTVYVPIFENRTFYRDVEFDLTKAVIREIEAKTPYKVVSCRENADTELVGSIATITKNILNRNQLNEVREAQMVMNIEITWRNLRTGEVLSQARPTGPTGPVITPSLPGNLTQSIAPLSPPSAPQGLAAPVAGNTKAPEDPLAVPVQPPLPGAVLPGAGPILISATASFVPEIGQSTTTAFQGCVNKAAIQIVSMMEKPW